MLASYTEKDFSFSQGRSLDWFEKQKGNQEKY